MTRLASSLGYFAVLFACAGSAQGQVAVQRSRFALPTANGHSAVVVTLADANGQAAARVTEFREHPYAAEEPLIDSRGQDEWDGNGFAAVYTRNLLHDAYFGLRTDEAHGWLADQSVDLDASGYLGWNDDETGGTGIVTIVQHFAGLDVTTYAFAPNGFPHAGLVMLLRVSNSSTNPVSGIQAFSLHNFHLGEGRPSSPYAIAAGISSSGETLVHEQSGTHATFTERGFAGVIVGQALNPIRHFGAAPGTDVYALVNTGADLPDIAPPSSASDNALGSWQFDIGTLAAGDEAWTGIVFAHSGNPSGDDEVQGWISDWIAERNPQQVLEDERARWAQLQTDRLRIPTGLSAYEESVLRQAAVWLTMGQVREQSTFVRQWLDRDGMPRRSRFASSSGLGSLPTTVTHQGSGAILASLPPGAWTYAWLRDGSYATAALAELGLLQEAEEALQFYLTAQAGRFASWSELEGHDLAGYQPTLVRYLGFGIEETDFNEFGPNLEFDGFGLVLWALRKYVDEGGPLDLILAHWTTIAQRIAAPLVGLIDPQTGLLRPDSSIWETHWNGRQRSWAYTNITAIRGLCDAAVLAEHLGHNEDAVAWREAALELRSSLIARLVDANNVLASNLEELESGSGYLDAAVVDAFAMGVLDPAGPIAQATLARLDEALLAAASGVGWARNDDRTDHGRSTDLSPWGSDYDSAEWVITDLRGAIAWREAGDSLRSDRILQWITAQTMANYLMFAETYDEHTGAYKFNAPMVGFGAGAYALALAHRGGQSVDPACGAYADGDQSDSGDSGGPSSGGTTSSTDNASGGETTSAATTGPPSDAMSTSSQEGPSTAMTTAPSSTASDGSDGCGCTTSSPGLPGPSLLGLVLPLLLRRRRPVVYAMTLAVGCGSASHAGDERGTSTTEVETTINPVDSQGSSATSDATAGGDDSTATDGDSASDTTTSGGGEVSVCPTQFTFAPTGPIAAVSVAGEWNNFDPSSATPLVLERGVFTTDIELSPGLWAYKLVITDDRGTEWILDPGQPRRKFVDEVENSAVLVRDCNLPRLVVDRYDVTGTDDASGAVSLTITYVDAAANDGPDAAAYVASLRSNFTERELTNSELTIDPATGTCQIHITNLPHGKHTLRLTAADHAGRRSEPLLMPFWIEPEPFEWNGALIYMAMTDRFHNGDATNDVSPTPLADIRGDFAGGDLQGIRAAIDDGTLDQLGVRALWLSPFNRNPEGAYLASDGVHLVTGYHGYWPTRAREVDNRIGGAQALQDLVASAHDHGIRVLQDFVVNHVHEDHEYVRQHPEWFRTGCVCGTPGCDWTANALECNFAPYLPDVDHRTTEANAAFVADALWWLETFDLDGLRIDAVKHVETAAVFNLATAVREAFETAGTRYFLMGETAMGWSDCADPCNDDNYGTISRYIGPHGLDGQFDFVLYHAVSYRTFAYGDSGMAHADYWLAHGLQKWPHDAVMTPYIGSHDTPRFVSLADYRGQDSAHDRGIPYRQWDDIAVAPGDDDAQRRTRLALTWLLALPGAPLLYYGDEYGQWGGADPNNRAMHRLQRELDAQEQTTLNLAQALGQARQAIEPLRTGQYVSLLASDDTLIFARALQPGNAAVVALTRATQPQVETVSVVQLGLQPGTVLHDALGGPDHTIDGSGRLTLELSPYGSAVLAP